MTPTRLRTSGADEVEGSEKSIWNDFDINKLRNLGAKLSPVRPEQHNEFGYTKICVENIQSEFEFWGSAAICDVLGSSPPFPVFNGSVRHNWANYSIDRFVRMKNGILLVCFASIEIRDKVLQVGF